MWIFVTIISTILMSFREHLLHIRRTKRQTIKVARRIEEAKAEALRMAADDHKAQMDALEETVRQSVEAEKCAESPEDRT